MLATSIGRLEKEITYSVTVGVKDRMVPGEGEGEEEMAVDAGRIGRTIQAGHYVTNGNSRA